VGYRRGRMHRRRMTRQLRVRDPDRRRHRHGNGRLRMLHAVAPATARFAAVPDGVPGFVSRFSRRRHRRGVGCARLRVVMAWHAPRFRHGRRRLRRSVPLEGHRLHVGPGNSRRYPVQHEGQAQQQSQEHGADGHVRTLTGVHPTRVWGLFRQSHRAGRSAGSVAGRLPSLPTNSWRERGPVASRYGLNALHTPAVAPAYMDADVNAAWFRPSRPSRPVCRLWCRSSAMGGHPGLACQRPVPACCPM